jgi:hypothetical protein
VNTVTLWRSRRTTFARIDGQPLAYPVKAGEMILWGLMETQRAPTFSSQGWRAGDGR